jgi:hypothetical protein
VFSMARSWRMTPPLPYFAALLFLWKLKYTEW